MFCFSAPTVKHCTRRSKNSGHWPHPHVLPVPKHAFVAKNRGPTFREHKHVVKSSSDLCSIWQKEPLNLLNNIYWRVHSVELHRVCCSRSRLDAPAFANISGLVYAVREHNQGHATFHWCKQRCSSALLNSAHQNSDAQFTNLRTMVLSLYALVIIKPRCDRTWSRRFPDLIMCACATGKPNRLKASSASEKYIILFK